MCVCCRNAWNWRMLKLSRRSDTPAWWTDVTRSSTSEEESASSPRPSSNTVLLTTTWRLMTGDPRLRLATVSSTLFYTQSEYHVLGISLNLWLSIYKTSYIKFLNKNTKHTMISDLSASHIRYLANTKLNQIFFCNINQAILLNHRRVNLYFQKYHQNNPLNPKLNICSCIILSELFWYFY